jgi:hypothetical protein
MRRILAIYLKIVPKATPFRTRSWQPENAMVAGAEMPFLLNPFGTLPAQEFMTLVSRYGHDWAMMV